MIGQPHRVVRLRGTIRDLSGWTTRTKYLATSDNSYIIPGNLLIAALRRSVRGFPYGRT